MLALLNWFVAGFIALGALFILGYPYALHFESQRLDKPVVVFTARIWRAALWSLLVLVFAGFLLVMAGQLATMPGGQPAATLGALVFALLGFGLGFIIGRLHYTYWRHDRHATLSIRPRERRAEYRNDGVQFAFALADVVQITEHTTRSGGSKGSLFSQYGYQVFELRDGTELLVTCLLYSLLGPQELIPAAQRATVQHRICWLPGDELNSPTLF
ncbi:hypothetical protein [Hymenobacter sp. PAMC 26628]|uniref:hypothetical protein n=1 Tax=Hymenobacter sp. PAMC 26628 TaxID=1484118 RepID=UPI0007705246|nr:hypothetical protein [Hymenobacter sp. PAMC 26628]AMJ64185.1 hypothetical protein AXW84_01100 [Hymenobacter sp. PAMC 26628]